MRAMRMVYLYGYLGERFGSSHRLCVSSVAEAVRLLSANFPGFMSVIKNGTWEVVRGQLSGGETITEEKLTIGLGGADIHLLPAIEGSGGGGKGIITAIAGVVIMGAAIIASGGLAAGGLAAFNTAMAGTAFTVPVLGAVTFSGIATFGGFLALAGISQLLSSAPKIEDYSSREDKKVSYMLNGAINRMEQGGPYPLIYGRRVKVGSVTASAGLHTEQIGSDEIIDDDDLDYATFEVSIAEGAPWGSVDKVGHHHVPAGEDFTITLTPDTGSDIAFVMINGSSDNPPDSAYTFENVAGGTTTTIIIGFTPPPEYYN